MPTGFSIRRWERFPSAARINGRATAPEGGVLSFLTPDALLRLARRQQCPLCTGAKTMDAALCRRCRTKLPSHMRRDLEGIRRLTPSSVANAVRQAARYIDVHFQSIRKFGGGKKH